MGRKQDIIEEYFSEQNQYSTPMTEEQIDYMNNRKEMNGFEKHNRGNSGQKLFYYIVGDDENIEIKSVWETNVVQLKNQLDRDNYTYTGQSRSMPRWVKDNPKNKQ